MWPAVGRALRRASRPAALSVFVPAIVSAQLAVNRVELSLRPHARDQRIAVIGVKNEGAQPVQAVVRLEDWDRSSDGTNQWYRYGTRTGSCDKMLSVFPLALSLEPGATQSIRVALDSAAAPNAECWAAAVVETVQPGMNGGQRVNYVLRTAVKIYVEPSALVSDGEIADLRIADGALPNDSSSNQPSHLELDFTNTGARHVVAQGTVEFRRRDNSVAARVTIPTVYALPGAHHTVKFAMPRLPKGIYVALATMDFGGDEIAAAQLEYEVR
jgi:P pilus assembly chaperone PapD